MNGNTVATLELESITPLWPGGPLGGLTYKCKDIHNCIGPFLPDSKQLIGRLRWMLRAIEASIALLRGKTPQKLGEVESLASRIFGSTSSASKLVVRVEFIYNPQAVDYMDIRGLEGDLPTKFLETAEIVGHSILRKRLGLPESPRLPSDSKIKEYFNSNERWLMNNMPVLEGLYRLLTIPRVRLALQAKKFKLADLYSKLPLRPAFNLRIQLRRRLGASLSKAEAGLVETLIPYTLTFMGLGKATTRGFGRFKLKRVEGGPENPQVEECIGKLRGAEPGSLHKAFKDCGCRLLELVAEAAGYEGFECDGNLLDEYRLELEEVEGSKESGLSVGGAVDKLQGLGVPALLVAMANSVLIEELKHPCPYTLPELSAFGDQWPPGCLVGKRNVADVVDALSAVGKVTLKSTWKYCHKKLKEPGPAYHTWVLGLPRYVKNKGGYLLARSAIRERCGIPLSKLLGGQPITPRRLSPLIVTVACFDERCSALLEPFITVTDFRDKLSKLIHVGKHGQLYHVASVGYIATSSKLGSVKPCPDDKAGMAVASGCNVGMTMNLKTYTLPANVELAAQLVALEWVRSLLS